MAAISWSVAPIIGGTLSALVAMLLPLQAQGEATATDTLTPSQQAIVDKLKASPQATSMHVGKMLNVVAALLIEEDARIVMPISGGRDVALVRGYPTERTDAGAITWRGEAEETGERAVLMLWKDGHLSGYFGYKGYIYTIKNLGGDIHVVSELDRGKLPPMHAPARSDKSPTLESADASAPPKPVAEPEVAPFPDPVRQALEAKEITIDLMILYTKKADDHYIGDLKDLLPAAIEDINHTFRNSGIGNVRLRLVHSDLVAYDEVGADHFDHLYRMVDGVGSFKGLRKLRTDKGADIVGLILDGPSGCGLSTRVGGDAEEAFFIVHHACATITYSIAHEIGHILGARHDRAIDPNDSPIPYAHGYVNGRKWRTMMSYNDACGGCPRIPFWSNPRIKYKAEPTGTHASDNARVILEQAERVSTFKLPIP